MSTEYITKQCLILSDNSFPITLEVVGEAGKPFNKTHHSIRSFIREKKFNFIRESIPIISQHFFGPEYVKDLIFKILTVFNISFFEGRTTL